MIIKKTPKDYSESADLNRYVLSSDLKMLIESSWR